MTYILTTVILVVCSYFYGVQEGKKSIVKILGIPKGCEISSIWFRRIGE